MYEIKVDRRGEDMELSLWRRTSRGARVPIDGSVVLVPKGRAATVEDLEQVLLPRAERLLGGILSDGGE